jgi:hypothetical protein
MTAAPPPLLIVYHADCIDGAASAWVVSEAAAQEGRSFHFLPYAHFDTAKAEADILETLKYSAHEIYFVDVAPSVSFLDRLGVMGITVHVLDHHQSAHDRFKNHPLPANAEVHIDPSQHSASLMIWNRLMQDKPAPELLTIIDKMDGDASGLKNNNDFAAAALIDSHNISSTANALQAVKGLAKMSFNEMAAKGEPTLNDQVSRISKLMAGAMYVDLQILPDTKPVRVPVVNANVQHFGRKISSALIAAGKAAGSGIAFAWSQQENGSVSMSLRSDGTPDCSLVAAHLQKTLGCSGGGHAGAAAVHFASLDEFALKIRSLPVKNPKPPAP